MRDLVDDLVASGRLRLTGSAAEGGPRTARLRLPDGRQIETTVSSREELIAWVAKLRGKPR